MGISQTVSGSLIYLDANIFIYALEGYSEFLKILTDLFDMIDDGRVRACTSELTLAETLIKPMADNNILLQEIYEDAIRTEGFLEVIPADRKILIKAARIRSQNIHLRLPDAIHLATAQHWGCDIFLTNDKHLKNYSNINVILLTDMICRTMEKE
jgi:predicted nucleic acid-binding protein